MRKGKISPELLQKIKDSVNMIEVVGEHVVLRKSGANYSGLCPFHSERTPSFSVSEVKQLFHCYGCKKGGDLVTFVMEILGISFPEAIEELSERARVQLPKDWTPSDGPEQDEKRSAQRDKLALAFKLNRFAASFFHQTLGGYSRGIEYCLARGVNEDIAKNFYLGAVLDSWDSLSTHLVAKKAPLDLAVELGLIRVSTKSGMVQGGGGHFDLFRNRILFPILNMRGKVAGFGGRALGDESPKYLNSTESLIFQKGKLAFGLYQAQRYIREQDEVILVEGYFDVLAMHAAGFQNVVATCGTSLTSDHLTLFKRFANRVTVLFDGDQAGILATERAMEMGLERGLVLYGATMPEGLDPDEMVIDPETGGVSLDGKERLTRILSESKPILDKKMNEMIALARQSPEDRTQALKKMGGWLARFTDPVGFEVRLELVQKQLGITRQLIFQAMGREGVSSLKGKPTSGTVHSQTPEMVPQSQAKMSRGDWILLTGLALGGEFSQLFTEVKRNLPPGLTLCDLIEYPPGREFMLSLFTQSGLLEQFRSIPESVLNGDLDIQVRSVITGALLSSDPPVKEEDFKRALSRSASKKWARFSQQIKKAITQAEVKQDTALQAQLMKEYLDVQRKMKEFSNFYDEE